jgi:hypothetical protein
LGDIIAQRAHFIDETSTELSIDQTRILLRLGSKASLLVVTVAEFMAINKMLMAYKKQEKEKTSSQSFC